LYPFAALSRANKAKEASMINVAMDVHVRNSVVHATAGDGRVLKKGRVRNTLLEVAAFLAPVERLALETGEPVVVTIENTTNARGVLRMLEQYGRGAGLDLTARAVDPRKMRVIAESVCKCDRLDAAVLNELAGAELRLPVCWFPDEETFALREHLRARADLVRLRTMAKNRVHSIFHRRCILTPEGDVFAARGRAFLTEMRPLLDEAGGALLDRWSKVIEEIDTHLKASDQDLAELARRERWRASVHLLRTMPGIGPVTSLTILAELGDIHRFTSRAGVANYAGLVPVLRGSNEKSYSGHITRRGPALLRAMLVQAAWSAIQHAPIYRALYQRIEERRGSQVAIVAVARRMLEDAWTMLKKNEPFRHTRGKRPDIRGAAGDATRASPSDAG
jgi:transposase